MPRIERIVHEERPSPLGRLFLAEGEAGGAVVPLAVLYVRPAAKAPGRPSGRTVARTPAKGAPTGSTRDPLRWLRRQYPGATLSPGPCPDLRKRLDRYFARRRWEAIAIPAEIAGTEFQRAVWKRIARIPPGRTMSYGEIAAAIGSPKAARGVGQACGSNPLSILVPCHRVVGVRGKLTGYGGGLTRKEWLLEWEGAESGRLL